MGKKIFVSYKYADDGVQNLCNNQNSTPRDYVTEFENILDESDNIYKGEHEDEDLSGLSEDEIWEKLKDKIYDSTVTIIFISPYMRDTTKSDRNQWIPWEVSYSMRETSRRNKNGDLITSRTNAMLAVVLPDSNGEYSYYLEKKKCCDSCCCTQHHTNQLFEIIRKNMFNLKKPTKRECPKTKDEVWIGSEHGYIDEVRWSDFKKSYNKYIDKACDRQDRMDEFELSKTV